MLTPNKIHLYYMIVPLWSARSKAAAKDCARAQLQSVAFFRAFAALLTVEVGKCWPYDCVRPTLKCVHDFIAQSLQDFVSKKGYSSRQV